MRVISRAMSASDQSACWARNRRLSTRAPTNKDSPPTPISAPASCGGRPRIVPGWCVHRAARTQSGTTHYARQHSDLHKAGVAPTSLHRGSPGFAHGRVHRVSACRSAHEPLTALEEDAFLRRQHHRCDFPLAAGQGVTRCRFDLANFEVGQLDILQI